MDELLLQRLLAVDDSRATEAPSHFDLQRELRAVRTLRPLLDVVLAQPTTVDDQVQDASFFADLHTVATERYLLGSSPVLAHLLVFRFSCFGRLFTGWMSEKGCVSIGRERFDAARDLIAARGYAFVEAEALQAPYTGPNPHLRDQSWWTRFFDYL